MTYKEGIEYKYPGYTLDRENLVVAKPGHFELGFEDIRRVMLSSSSDTSLNEIRDQLFKQSVFLNKETFKVAYTSYPRSGNTFLRKYFETITSVATGSDQVMKFNLNIALQFSGLKGEGITDGRVWI